MQPPTYTVFLKNFFSRKDVSVICFILAIVIKTLLVFYFQQTDSDKLYQVMAGKNLIEGHGLTIKQVHVSNLSKETYEPLVGWPPGYSVLFAIIYSAIHNVDASCFILDIICFIPFFFALRKLLKQLQFPDYLINLLILFNGCLITFYIAQSTPTDFLTLLLTVFVCSLSIALYREEKPVLKGILLGVFNAMTAWFRYIYIPISFVIPGVLLWNGWFKKDKKLLAYGAYTMALALLSSIALLSLQEPYTVPTEKGIFWSNLMYLDPVLFSAFTDLNFFLMQLSHLTGLSYTTCVRMLQRINMVPFLILLVWLFYYSFKRKWIASGVWQLFIIIGGLTAISIFSVLAILSVRYSMYFPLPAVAFWTYVGEDRYFIFIHLFIVIITARWLFMNAAPAVGIRKWAQRLFLFLCSVVILHGVYYLAKNFTFDRRNFSYEVEQKRMNQYIDSAIRENKKNNIDVVVTSSYTFPHKAVLMGAKGLIVPSELNAKEIYADRPTKIIAVLVSQQIPFFSPFLKREGIKLETKIGGFYFYSYYVTPNTTLQN